MPDEPLSNTFWDKVEKTDYCWNWKAAQSHEGYGAFSVRINGIHRVRRTHRLSYESLVGRIPNGLVIDHLCRNRLCVNPEHLELVTPRTNTLRGESIAAINHVKTHCPQGHEYNAENTYVWKAYNRTARRCRVCNMNTARRYRKNKAKEA